jgi:hypothetical protein
MIHRMQRTAPAILWSACVALAACGNATWSKPGTSDADYQRDWQQCGVAASGFNPPVYDARTMSASPPSSSQSLAQQQNACMFARGWQLVPHP